MKFIYIAIGFTIANFFWQAATLEPNWGAALERSWFQVFAIAYIWFFKVTP